MPNILERVRVEGLWDDHSIEIKLHPDVNFLIGVNGSGKTSVVNMVAAALNADFTTLDRLPFRRIELRLAEIRGRRRPSIEVKKRRHPGSPFLGIRYSIKDQATGSSKDYSLDDIEEQLAIREYPRYYYRDLLQRTNAGLTSHLRTLVQVSWLSIHRGEGARAYKEERGLESSVDRKLVELSNDLVKYFSLLAGRVSSQNAEFQKKALLSLLSTSGDQSVFEEVEQLPISEEKAALRQVFLSIGVAEKEFSKRLEQYFSRTQNALVRLREQSVVGVEDFANLVGALRLHQIVQNWHTSERKKAQIMEPRDTFLQTVNSMVQRKELYVDDRGELVFRSESGKTLALTQLSSGEKQLLIILGEALLQSKTPTIYIADEPELSLHVQWQEHLIRNLLMVNPNAQIFFATHSPDIVGSFASRVHDMEVLIR